MKSVRSLRSLTGVALAVAGLAAGCGDDQPFQVAPGTIEVTVSTTGDDIDPDGYVITTDFGPDVAVAANAMETISDVPPGTYDFTVGDIADNCTLAGANPRTVQVTSGQTTTVTLEVTCVALVGDALVTTATSGNSIDTDGYTLSVDGGAAQTIGVNDSVLVAGLSTGDHDFELGGVAANCMVDTNPQTGTVVAGDTVTVAFTIACASTMGSIRVNTNTTGSNLDPDGYQVSVDGGTAVPIAINSNITIGGLTAGAHTVAISDVAANCTVSGGTSQNVNVTAGQTINATFNVTCTATTGDLTVTTSTSGSNLDPDGYTFTIDGGSATAIGINDSQTVNGVASGTRTVALSGVAANCTVSGGSSQDVNVPAGGSVTAAFTITCAATATSKIAFQSNRSGTLQIFLMDEDGSNQDSVTSAAAGTSTLADFAPSGTQLAYMNVDDIWTINTDGSGATNVTMSADAETRPAWSPDGTQIAFMRQLAAGGEDDIWVMNADGSGQTQLTTDAGRDADPAWSPDGTQIAFVSDRLLATNQIFVMDADGMNQADITTAGGSMPDWSPDGTKIVFSSGAQIFTINPDGSGLSAPLTALGNNFNPSWSDDGTQITFSSDRTGNVEIFVMNADGSGQTNISNTAGVDAAPDWQP